MAGNGKHARAAVPGSAAVGVGFGALEDDRGNGAERFDIVNDGGAAVEADDSREGRPDARIAALAFQRFHKSRFFATFVSARAGVDQEVEIEAGAEDIFTEIAARISFFKRAFDDIEDVAILAADIDETAIGVDGAPGDDDALDHLVRIHFHQRAILAGAGFGFIGVTDDVFRFRRILGDEGPLHAGGEACAAASAEVGFFYFVDDGFGGHLLESFFEGLIAAGLKVDVDLVGILHAEALTDEDGLEFVAVVDGAGDDADGFGALAPVEILDETIEFQRSDVLVEIVIDLHGGRASAGAEAFDFLEGEDAVGGGFLVAEFKAFFGVLEKFGATAQHAGDIGADLDVMFAHGLAAQHGVIGEGFLDLHMIQIEAGGNFGDQFVGDVAEFVLAVNQHGDERAALEGIEILQLFEFGGQIGRKLHGEVTYPPLRERYQWCRCKRRCRRSAGPGPYREAPED